MLHFQNLDFEIAFFFGCFQKLLLTKPKIQILIIKTVVWRIWKSLKYSILLFWTTIKLPQQTAKAFPIFHHYRHFGSTPIRFANSNKTGIRLKTKIFSYFFDFCRFDLETQIEELKDFMDAICKSFPNLRYLSMLKNPACPNFLLDGKGADDYKRFR